MNILVTGATGNVGREVIQLLVADGHEVTAGSRNSDFDAGGAAIAAQLDFTRGIAPPAEFDAIFLMRPPQLADPEIFRQFLENYPRETLIVFLSVQGADTKTYLPHAKIEKVITKLGFRHVFVRPSYFMDNLLTTLWPELVQNHRIYLPAGNLKLDWVSVADVAAVCANALSGKFAIPAVSVCSGELKGFTEVCLTINRIAGTRISYERASLPGFVWYLRKTGNKWTYIGVMLLLHFFPRFERGTPTSSDTTRAVLGRQPETLEAFIRRNKLRFKKLA